jgi:hypothetical protein
LRCQLFGDDVVVARQQRNTTALSQLQIHESPTRLTYAPRLFAPLIGGTHLIWPMLLQAGKTLPACVWFL